MSLSSPLYTVLLIAFTGGMAISLQSSVVSNSGATLGAFRTAFAVHLGGAIVGGIMLAVIATRGEQMPAPQMTLSLVTIFLIAGFLGMIVLPSVAVAFPRLGLAAGQMTMIMGQLFIAMIIDSFGLFGAQTIPITWQRLVGLVLMGLAIYMMLPRE